MTWKRVNNFRLGYSVNANRGLFYYDLHGDTSTHQFAELFPKCGAIECEKNINGLGPTCFWPYRVCR